MASKDYLSMRADSGIFFYVRRVPKEVAHLDKRGVIRKNLGTRDRVAATLKAREINQANEELWSSLLMGAGEESAWAKYESALRIASALGFSYKTARELIANGDELLDRIDAAREHAEQKPVMDVVLGTVDKPQPKLSDLWRLYERHNKAAFEGMSKNQYRKHKVPRERAIAYAASVLGDMVLGEISRSDVLRFRDWWIDKMTLEGLKADTANRSFTDLKGMLSVVDGALHTEFGRAWERLRIKPTNKTKTGERPPIPLEWVQDVILRPGALDGLNLEARTVVYLMAETGMRVAEACNLRRQDIFLDAAIPYVAIAERHDRRHKTEYSVRTIPLVGCALWAMRQLPDGFKRYADKEDLLSKTVNSYLRENELMPSEEHTLYSLRHTFQDRILAAKAPDRLQADLMGHEFERPKYGEGSTLKQKLELLEAIKFKWTAPLND